MLKCITLAVAALFMVASSGAAAQVRPANAVAVDGSDGPPLANEFGPMADVPDGYDTSAGGPLRSSIGAVPSSGAPDVGAFRTECPPTHTLADDPIVFPGQPGAAHIHTFFGNGSANAFSTYATLRTSGLNSCKNKLWGTAYWIPAMLDGPGVNAKIVWPEKVGIYYKRFPKNHPECTPGNPRFRGTCVAVPNGLKAISGYDMISGKSPNGYVDFKCVTFSTQDAGGLSGPLGKDMVTALSTCPAPIAGHTGVKYILDVMFNMPHCWDGKRLDSPDHRSHISDEVPDADGNLAGCPKTHPYRWPTYTAQVLYKIDGTVNQSGEWTTGQQTWYMSSDRMPGKTVMRPGTTAHFDLFEANNNAIKKVWTDNCIDKNMNCSGGSLGDGTVLIDKVDFTTAQRPKSVRPKMTKEAVEGHVHVTGPR